MTPEEVADRLQQIHSFNDRCRADIVFAIKAAVLQERQRKSDALSPASKQEAR